MARVRCGYGMIVLVCLGVALAANADSLALRNYDDDPDLATAMQYDRGETTDRSKANREKAEEYYLKYLDEDIPSFQKARVYARLGALFTVESSVNDRPRDEEKGKAYLEKVLELEPVRIDTATIRARTLLASLRESPREEILRRRLDNHEWLLSLNEDKYRKLFLPLNPGQTEIRHVSLQSLKNGVPMLIASTVMDAVAAASILPNREEHLGHIIERFPGTEIADLARKALQTPIRGKTGVLAGGPRVSRPWRDMGTAPQAVREDSSGRSGISLATNRSRAQRQAAAMVGRVLERSRHPGGILVLGGVKYDDQGRIRKISLSGSFVVDSDLRVLEQLPSLKILHLRRTVVSQECLKRLHKALPDCRIFWSPVIAESPYGPRWKEFDFRALQAHHYVGGRGQ